MNVFFRARFATETKNRVTCTIGWSENHFFEVNVSRVALRYQNTVYEILTRSVCENPRKIVEVLEMR